MDNSELLEYLEAPDFVQLLHEAKVYGFSDFQIGRAALPILAAEYPAQTNYLYLSYQ